MSYPITLPPGRRVSRVRAAGGLSEAEVRAALYPSRREHVTPLGTTLERVLASIRAGRAYAPEDLAGPWR